MLFGLDIPTIKIWLADLAPAAESSERDRVITWIQLHRSRTEHKTENSNPVGGGCTGTDD